MRNSFDEKMEKLHTLIIEIGARCESGIASAVKAMLEQDREKAKKALEQEEEINRLERDIEQLCYALILRQQPVAKDLRHISAALKMVTDLERIGDQAADISEIALLGNVFSDDGSETIKSMAKAAISMVSESIDAYIKQDLSLAHKVIESDSVVDDYFDEIKRELALQMAARPLTGEAVVDMLMAAKYLERIADHAVNIAEWVFFVVNGEYYSKEL